MDTNNTTTQATYQFTYTKLPYGGHSKRHNVKVTLNGKLAASFTDYLPEAAMDSAKEWAKAHPEGTTHLF